jgi:glycerol uptake facilitator-like aquaporin
MTGAALPQRSVAEALGTMLLVATVVGSGIMADRLAGGNVAIALLGNTIPTGAILVVLISILGPLSGAHFNPVVTGFFAIRGEFRRDEVLPYVAAQIIGGIVGTLIAHAMFGLPIFAAGITPRTGTGQWIGEIVATFTLLTVIVGGLRYAPERIPVLVGLTITAAYWFTSSTSFANPAVTIARAFTPTFAGILPADVPGFVLAQCVGAALALGLAGWLFKRQGP